MLSVARVNKKETNIGLIFVNLNTQGFSCDLVFIAHDKYDDKSDTFTQTSRAVHILYITYHDYSFA